MRFTPRSGLALAAAVGLAALALFMTNADFGPDSGRNRTCAASCKCGPSGGGAVLSGESGLEGCPEGRRPGNEGGDEESSVSMRPGDGKPARMPNPWFFLERAYPYDRIPLDVWRAAREQAQIMKAEARGRTGNWQFRGPNNVGGRITDLAIDPTDANSVYAGAAEGGVLRTTDAGQHWAPVFDSEAALSIGAVALDPLDPQIVYAGTGEVNPGGGSVAYGGIGVMRSTDGGNTWTPLGLTGTGSIGRIRIDPTDPQRIYVAAMGDLWSKGPDRGVYRTTDGGTNWQKVLYLSDSTGAVDLIVRPDQPQTIWAAMWERIRRPRSYQYGGVTCGVYKSTDGGDTWALAGGGLPPPGNNIGRIGLSICTSQPQYMHAVYADKTGYFAGLYRTTNGGTSWTRTSDGALSSVFSSYGWWFGNCRTSSVDPNRIFVLGLDFYRSTNGGASWSEVSGGMHVDHHAMEFGPGASPVIYEGNDGGLYRSTNGGSAWSFLPDQPITQFYRLALDPHNPNALYGGAQDNGTNRTLTGALDDWTNIFGGDGFQPLVDPANSNRIWAQYQYGSLYMSQNGGGSWAGATNGIGYSDRFNWNTAVVIDPTNTSRLYYGTQKLYRSTNGTSWTAISPDLTGGAGGGSQGNVYGTITTIGPSPLDGQVIWVGTDDGRVQRTINGGTNWADVSLVLPDRWITSVHPSMHARETCFVTLSGFRWGSPLPHIYRTTDLGTTWTAVSGNLPDAPVNDCALDPLDPTRIFAATDLGVFQTVDGGANWSALGSDLPNVVVNQLAFEPVARLLYAATYGRSFWSYDVGLPTDVAGRTDAGAPGRLLPPAPNPMREGTWLSWERGAASGPVTVEILGPDGRRIWTSSMTDRVWWNGRDLEGRRVAAGTYFCTAKAGTRVVGGRRIVVAP